MTKAMSNLAVQAHPRPHHNLLPAFKQSETKEQGGTSSKGWVTFLKLFCVPDFN